MPRQSSQKIKLLCMLEILRKETDAEHPLRTSELCSRLIEKGIPCDRRTLPKDVELLNEMDFEVMVTNVGHEKAYYVADRNFSVPELKIIMDAIQAASFITPKKTEELTRKIAQLSGTNQAELLMRNVVCFNTRKHSNEYIYYSVDRLEEAVRSKKKASFLYFDLNENHERVYRKSKARYEVDPVALVFNDDNYYLVCFSSKYDGICNYRVDRMEDVQIEDTDVASEAVILSNDVGDYTKQAFKMYGGPIEDCVLQFDKSLIGVIYDKFGEDTQMIRQNSTTFIATVKIQVSPTFWGWIFQFAEGKNRMRILAPDALVEDYKSRAAAICDGI